VTEVAVIGARGFVGRALVARLQRDGVTVHAFGRDRPFAVDGVAVPDVARASTVFYLANSINPAIAENDPAAVAADLATFDAFVACLAACDAPPVVVYPNSGGTVYDPAVPPPYAETSPVAPMNAYGKAKLEMERRLLASPLRAVSLRITSVYGPGQPVGRGQGVIAHWLDAAARDEPLRLFGSPSASRDYVYVEDVADAMALVGPETPPVVNVGSGVETTLETLAALVSDVVGGVKVERVEDRGFDVPRSWVSIDLARASLGWEPRVSLREGLARTWESVR
jgi:UDP-glucose 4-epimerase